MTEYAVLPPETVSLPIENSQLRFPVRRVYCIGRNYAAHAIEMGHDPDRDPPFFFQKNPNNLDPSLEFPFPRQSQDVHHEVEMAVALKTGGTHIPVASAEEHILGYALALDMTRRDLQSAAKSMGRPWEIGKAFERSAPIGPIHLATDVGHLTRGRLSLSVNGARRQEGDLDQMIWKTPEIIAYLSNFFELAPGDVILTGTPSGVGPVSPGDVLDLTLEGLKPVTVAVVEP